MLMMNNDTLQDDNLAQNKKGIIPAGTTPQKFISPNFSRFVRQV
jgi:hypothetical protein